MRSTTLLPLRVGHHAPGAPQTLIDVTHIERRDVAEGEFTPPAGFRKAALPEVFGVATAPGAGR